MPSKFTVAADGNYAGSLVKLARYSKRNWKTRYFTLTASPPELCYFKKKGDAKEAGKITIDASTTAELANDARRNNSCWCWWAGCDRCFFLRRRWCC